MKAVYLYKYSLSAEREYLYYGIQHTHKLKNEFTTKVLIFHKNNVSFEIGNFLILKINATVIII